MKKQLPLILFLIIIVLVFLIIKPFTTSILFAIILSYIFYPFNNYIKIKIKKKNISALLTTLIIFLIVIIPTIFIAHSLITESYSTYILAKQKITGIDFCSDGQGVICETINVIEKDILEKNFNQYLRESLEEFSSKAVSEIYNFVKRIAESILKIFMFIILTFFLLRDGDTLTKNIKSLLPFNKKQNKQIMKTVSDMLHAVVYGSIVVAIVQGAIAFLGFWLFGVNNPLLWGIIVLFASFVPYLGATLGWLPVSLVYLFDAIISSDAGSILKYVFLIIYGTFVVSGIDNIIKPKIIGNRGHVHPAFIFLGVAGGLYLLGPIGVFIGPVIMALFLAFIKIYEEISKK